MEKAHHHSLALTGLTAGVLGRRHPGYRSLIHLAPPTHKKQNDFYVVENVLGGVLRRNNRGKSISFVFVYRIPFGWIAGSTLHKH